ncbi:MAG: radical SAM protein, partial [Candidatus Pacebacteria bacterium]|nr:radical SAM protein [Candidatus Paceibacterota bacterium]
MKTIQMLKMGCGVLSAKFLRKKFPLNVMLSITNRCMSQCRYCDIPNRNQRELSTDEVFSLIDQICSLGCQRFGIWGGEPLMRKDIEQVINYAKNKGLFVTMDSNGYLLPQRIHQLQNLDHLLLAFDGDQKAHELNRGSGSFQKVMRAIESANGKVPFWTITVLTKNNVGSIDFILEQAGKYGFLATFQLLHHNDQLSSDYQHLLPSRHDCQSAIKKLISEKKKGAPIASSLNYLNHILNWPDYKTANYPFTVNGVKCWAGDV